VLRPVATLELVYMDERGSTGATVVNIPASSSIEVGDAQATALASLIAPMTDCTLVKYRVSWRVVIEDPGIAGSSAAIVNTGVFIFSDFDGGNLGLITIPAIKDEIVETSGNGAGVAIDQENEAVLDFVAQVIDMNASNPFGDIFYRLETAYRQSRV